MSSAAPHSDAGRSSAGARVIAAIVASLRQTGELVCGEARLEAAHVHEARKTLKKIRAGLRMLADADGVDMARANGLCRDLGRLLSGLRDIDVCLLTLGSLTGVPGDESAALAGKLRARRREIHLALQPDPDEDVRIAADLRGIEQALIDLDESEFTARQLTYATQRARQLGERRYRALEADGSEEAFHSLRKAAKRELYQRRYLVEAFGSHDPRLDLLDVLGEHLGRHQDLSVLREVATELDGLGRDLATAIEAEIGAERARCLVVAEQAYGARP